MTMPKERTRAVLQTRDLLLELADSTANSEIPSRIRDEAACLLRHFPGSGDMAIASRSCPEWFGPPLEAAEAEGEAEAGKAELRSDPLVVSDGMGSGPVT
jgi:hypothetical protein